jgi:hypothetical protein
MSFKISEIRHPNTQFRSFGVNARLYPELPGVEPRFQDRQKIYGFSGNFGLRLHSDPVPEGTNVSDTPVTKQCMDLYNALCAIPLINDPSVAPYSVRLGIQEEFERDEDEWNRIIEIALPLIASSAFGSSNPDRYVHTITDQRMSEERERHQRENPRRDEW